MPQDGKLDSVEEQLRTSELRFRSVVETIADGIIQISADGKVIAWNRAATEMFGWEEAEIVGRTLTDLMPARYREDHARGLERLRAGDSPRLLGRTVEVNGLRRDGTEFPIELVLSRWQHGDDHFYCGIVRDVTSRRQREAQLWEQRTLHAALLEAQTDLGEGMTLVDGTSRRMVHANRALGTLFGYEQDDLLALPDLLDLIAPPSQSVVQRALERGHSGRAEADRFELTGRRKDGTTIELEVSVKRIDDCDPVRLVMVFRDVTERKRSDEALRRHEENFRGLIEGSPDPICVVRETVIYANAALLDYLGYTADELIGRSVAEMMPQVITPESLASASVDLPKALKLGRTDRTVELQFRRRDGRAMAVEVSAVSLRYDGEPAIVAFLRDVTERVHSAEVLRRSEENVRALLDALPLALVVWRGPDVIYVNPYATSYLGFASCNDVIGRPYAQLVAEMIHPDDLAMATERGASAATGAATPIELRVRRRDGGEVRAETFSVPIVFNGEPAHVSILRDVTEQKQLQAQILLNDRMTSMGILASGVAHEINNPLAYVMGNLSLISEQIKAGGVELRDFDAMIRETREGAERVRAIVRDLKMFARVDEEHVAAVDVRRVIESSLSMAWSEIRHRARLVKDFPPGAATVTVRCNEARLGQVFLNLLINAAQSIGEGHAEQHVIKVSVSSDAGWVAVAVSDTGSGIAAEIRDRIFEPFYTTKPIGIGTGLGLPICKRIVEALGGVIVVESQPGHGTTFTVRLPLDLTELAPPPAPVATATKGRRGRILVVDDEVLVSRMLRRALAPEHEVEVADNGRDALDRLLGDGPRYDVVLCDLMMPEITGMELHAELLSRAPDIAARVIFLTGGTFTTQAREFLDSVPNPRFDKPIDLANLRAFVRGRLDEAL